MEDGDITIKEGGEGLSSSERQWMQVEKIKEGDSSVYFDADALALEMSKWKFPLHFIDFENAGVIPHTSYETTMEDFLGGYQRYLHAATNELLNLLR